MELVASDIRITMMMTITMTIVVNTAVAIMSVAATTMRDNMTVEIIGLSTRTALKDRTLAIQDHMLSRLNNNLPLMNYCMSI